MRRAHALLPIGVVDVPDHDGQKPEARPARQPHCRARSQQRQGGEDAETAVAPEGAGVYRDGRDQGRHPEDEQGVGDVGADDIAERNARGSGQAGLKACGQLRCGCAHAHNCQADQHRRQAQSFGDPDGSADQEIPARDEQDEAKQQEKNVDRHGLSERC